MAIRRGLVYRPPKKKNNTHTAPIIFHKTLSVSALGPKDWAIETRPCSSGCVIMRLWLKMDFSCWSRTASQLLLRIRKHGVFWERRGRLDVSRSAWWERIVTDYVFCFAFCVSCRIAIWGKVSLSWHGLEMISARAPVILCIVLLLLKPGPPSREGHEDPHPPEMGVTGPQAHI